jgi:integrase
LEATTGRNYEGKTPAIRDHQARELLDAPDASPLKGKRDRAILATLLYIALRRDELCRLKVKDYKKEWRGVPHMKILGKLLLNKNPFFFITYFNCIAL